MKRRGRCRGADVQARRANEFHQREWSTVGACCAYTHRMKPSDPSSRVRRRQPVRRCIGTLTLRRKLWIELDGRFAIGEGGAELLREVERRGSLAEAARRVGWSYRHAWGYLRRAESVLGVSLMLTRPGKGSARGTVITRAAREIVGALLPQLAKDRSDSPTGGALLQTGSESQLEA